jgi:hypothetical protein
MRVIKKEKGITGPTRLSSNPNRPVVPPVVPLDSPQASGKVSKNLEKSSASLPNVKQQIKLTLKSSMATKPTNKTVLEKLGDDQTDASNVGKKRKADDGEIKVKKEKKKEKKSGADRRQELLKQLKAVENAIAKKRTKMDE